MVEFFTEVSEPIRYAGPDSDARAAHEGVVCALLDGIDALAAAGATVGRAPWTAAAHPSETPAAAGASVGGRLHLVGGGARSPAYRQIAADCWSEPVRVPDADEAVATGACAQAAQHAGLSLAEAADAWGLGVGGDVAPSPGADSAAVRTAYRQAAEAAAGSTSSRTGAGR